MSLGGVGGWKAYQDHQRDRAATGCRSKRRQTPASTALEASAPETRQRGAGQLSSEPAQARPRLSNPQPAGEAAAAAQTSIDSSAGQLGRCSRRTQRSFEVTIRPKDRAWVSVKSDGKFVVRGIIKPPDVKTIRANDQVVFYTGNAGEVEVSFNGKNVPLTGGANEEQTLVFDSRGVLPRTAAPVTRSNCSTTRPIIMKNIGENVVRIEAEALRALADRLAGPMAERLRPRRRTALRLHRPRRS